MTTQHADVSPHAPEVPHLTRPARGEPVGALVLLHGRGSDEHDLVPLLDALDPDRRLIGITPRAPLQLPPGGSHWYVVPRVGYPDAETFHATYAQVGAWLDGLPEAFGLPWSKIVLGGFSQGAVMSLALGLGAGRPQPAGVIALSGFIPEVRGFELDLPSHQDVPVAIGHGTADPVIDVVFARAARSILVEEGLDVLYRETPMFHGIDPLFVDVVGNWLTARLPEADGQPAVMSAATTVEADGEQRA